MAGLTNERIDEILHKETVKKEELDTILRSVYTRYMYLYENYFEDTDALDDDKIAEFRSYHEETGKLIKYYYMDIPQDICKLLYEIDKYYTARLLGTDWRKYLSELYKDFKENNTSKNKNKEYLKAEFKKQTMEEFYDAMDYTFRDGFGTGSKTESDILSGIKGLLFGKQE